MIKTLLLLSLTSVMSTNAVRLEPFFTPVPASVPTIPNQSLVWSEDSVNKCNLCRAISSFVEAHEDVICAKDDKKCEEFITDEFDDVICKILCESQHKKWYDIL